MRPRRNRLEPPREIPGSSDNARLENHGHSNRWHAISHVTVKFTLSVDSPIFRIRGRRRHRRTWVETALGNASLTAKWGIYSTTCPNKPLDRVGKVTIYLLAFSGQPRMVRACAVSGPEVVDSGHATLSTVSGQT